MSLAIVGFDVSQTKVGMDRCLLLKTSGISRLNRDFKEYYFKSDDYGTTEEWFISLEYQIGVLQDSLADSPSASRRLFGTNLDEISVVEPNSNVPYLVISTSNYLRNYCMLFLCFFY
jgi:hypothetical protein